MKKKLKMLLLFLCLIGLYIPISTYCSYHCLKVDTTIIETDQLTSPVTLVQLSDIHSNIFGTDNQELITKIENINPDMIVMTGDIINSEDTLDKVENIKFLISELAHIAPVYGTLGNHEIEYMEHTDEDLVKQFSEAGAIILDSEYRDLEVKGQQIRIGGIYGYCLPERYPSANDEVKFLRTFEATDSYKILLSHLPYAWVNYGFTADYDIDLIFSGHVHGGQVRIPLIGGLYDPEIGFFPGNVRGIYKENNTTVVLSSGLGSNKKKLPRFNNIPEIVVIKLNDTFD